MTQELSFDMGHKTLANHEFHQSLFLILSLDVFVLFILQLPRNNVEHVVLTYLLFLKGGKVYGSYTFLRPHLFESLATHKVAITQLILYGLGREKGSRVL